MLANNQLINFFDVEDMLIKIEDTIHHNFVFSKQINYLYFNYIYNNNNVIEKKIKAEENDS